MKKYYILATNSTGNPYFAHATYDRNNGGDVPVGYDTHEEAIEAAKKVLRLSAHDKVIIFRAAIEVTPKVEVGVDYL